MAKTWAECETIDNILENAAQPVEGGVFISVEDYKLLLNDLQEREEAIVNDFIQEG